MTEEQVRKDLREWRKQERAVNACLDAKARMERQVQVLRGYGMADEAERVSRQIESLNIDKLILNAQRKRDAYLRAIDKLNDIERTIVVESIINGKSYIKIAYELAYSESSVKWHAKNAIKKICAYFNKKGN